MVSGIKGVVYVLLITSLVVLLLVMFIYISKFNLPGVRPQVRTQMPNSRQHLVNLCKYFFSQRQAGKKRESQAKQGEARPGHRAGIRKD